MNNIQIIVFSRSHFHPLGGGKSLKEEDRVKIHAFTKLLSEHTPFFNDVVLCIQTHKVCIENINNAKRVVLRRAYMVITRKMGDGGSNFHP